ncbi:MAG: autotransporter-associated beta strand repeat-containing protein [Thermoguttaceae bacterium]|nr:autotransporter-associated beta strand repeat-containing protein [Thermoguttaceae bacterium]
MKRTIASLLFLIGLSFAVTTYAEIVTYSNDFTAKKMSGQYRVDDGSSVYGTNLAPYYPNLRYYESGGSNFRFNYGENFMKLANASGCYGTLQMDASNFVSTATNFDLTAGDLVYECFYACSWNGTGAGNFHHGISINNNQMLFIYHPGYNNGAFRIEGSFGTCNNQNIGFTPKIGNATDFTMMKLTISRDADAGVYRFKTEFGQATRTDDGWETAGYTYQYNHTCSIATIDAAGGIQSIGPYGKNNNDACVTNLRLTAPFSDAAVAKAMEYSTAQQYVISNDQPTHWYKFDDPSTNVLKDYGSNPVDVTTLNIDSAIRDTEPIALFNGVDTRIDLTGTDNISGNWTAEFYINPSKITGRQALTSGSNGSLRWIMDDGVPGFTKWSAYDARFKNPDGTKFSYDLSQFVDEWIHVTYVRDDKNMFFYINGELVGINDPVANPGIDLPISRTIGSNGTGELFSGMVDDIAFYSSALTADQIWTHAFPESIWYYNVNTADMSAENWTIDGTDKRGAWFIKNGEQNTATYDKQVILDEDGSFKIGADKNLTLSGVVSGSGALEKIDAGTLTLSGDNTYSGATSVKAGTLTLTGDAVKANSSIEIAEGATLEYNVPFDEKQLTFSNDVKVSGGSVLKTGDGKLKILAAEGLFQSGIFTVKEGELDFKGLCAGDLVIKNGAVFSPGNSVGSLDLTGNFTLESGATLLLEVGKDSSGDIQTDELTVSGVTTFADGSIIKIALDSSFENSFEDGDQASILLPSGILDGDGNPLDLDRLTFQLGMFDLLGYDSTTGLLTVAYAAPSSGSVPEPSTWALLILGVAGLFFVRKKNK